MNRALWIASSGMAAQQINLDTIANDLANVSTVGYKHSRAEFAELLGTQQRPPGSASESGVPQPSGLALGHGVRAAATRKDFGQGALQQTHGPLDLAIEGGGFFGVQLADGSVAYTRNGAFQTDADGRIVDSAGRPLEGDLTIPEGSAAVMIADDGTVSARIAGESAPQVIGQIQLSRFANENGLQALADGLFMPTEASGEASTAAPGEDGRGRLFQGFVEASNVNVVDEMVAMITAQRAYELNARAVATADSMLGTLTDVLR